MFLFFHHVVRLNMCVEAQSGSGAFVGCSPFFLNSCIARQLSVNLNVLIFIEVWLCLKSSSIVLAPIFSTDQMSTWLWTVLEICD